jgi:SagB-type dehydrogenase family enzyme
MRSLAMLSVVCLLLCSAAAAGEEGTMQHTSLSAMALPAPSTDGTVSVEKALAGRRSIRDFSDEPLTLADVSQLLWAAYGITYTREGMPDFVRGGLKTAPSAGARYPLDIYLVAGNVTGLEPGIYYYVPEGHVLHLIAKGDSREALAEACLGQAFVGIAPAAIVYSAVFERCTVKYGQRGRDRYVCMDLGHSGENVYLQCGALGLGTCAVGAFDDAAVHSVIGMTDEEEALYVMPVGHPAKR